MTGQLERIHIYPIKGAQGVALQHGHVRPRGLANDRRWMLVDADGSFLSQRMVPSLARVRAQVTPFGMRLSAPCTRELDVPRPDPSAPRLKVVIWKDTVEAVCSTPAINAWCSDVVGQPCRLVLMDHASRRSVHRDYNPGAAVVSFADGFPLLLTSTASLGELNARMAAPVPMTRFRANLVVGGFAPFAEDGWSAIQIGDMQFDVVKPCSRCVVTTIDQNTLQAGKEPLRTLSTFRRKDGKVYFGENLIPRSRGIIRAGDAVAVLAKRALPVFPV